MDDESPLWPLTRDELLKQVFGYQKLLTAYGFTLLNDWQAAEDIVQETLLFVAGNHEKYDGERLLLPWSRGIVRMKCLNKLRSRRKESPVADAELLAQLLDEKLTDLWDERAATEMAKRIQALRNCMAELPARACRLLGDFYVDRKPGKDIADREKMDASNLRSHLSRIRKRLRDCVSERLSEAAAAEKEGYWRLLDDYYGQDGSTASADVREAISQILSEDGGAGRLLEFFIETCAFGICIQEMRPLAEGIPNGSLGEKRDFPSGGVREVRKNVFTKQSRTTWFLAAAAAVALMATLWWTSLGKARLAESIVTSVRGEAVYESAENGLRFPLEIGKHIPPGSRVFIGDGEADLVFQGRRGAKVRMFPNTTVIFGDHLDNTKNVMKLERGAFRADAESQRRHAPLAVLTETSRATVMGTEFVISVTALEVDEGLVQVERLSDGARINVPARHRVEMDDMVLEEASAPDLKRGLVGWWSFDGTEDEVAKDSSGNGGDLRIVKARPVPGVFGGAMEFSDGAYALTGSSPALSITGDLTMSAWVRPQATTGRSGIIGKYLGEPVVAAEGQGIGRTYSMKLGDGLPEAYLSEKGDYFSTKRLTAGGKIPLREWTHLAIVFEAGKSLRIYRDGKLVTMETKNIPLALHENDSPLLIAATYSLNEPRNFFTGALDELRIYSRALGSREVEILSQKEPD